MNDTSFRASLLLRSLAAGCPVAGVAGLAIFAGNASAQESGFGSFLGERPPELVANERGWLDGSGELSLAALAGRVVWLEFSFLH